MIFRLLAISRLLAIPGCRSVRFKPTRPAPTPGGAPFPGERCGRPVQRSCRGDDCVVIPVCPDPTTPGVRSEECALPDCRSRSDAIPGAWSAEAGHLPGVESHLSAGRSLLAGEACPWGGGSCWVHGGAGPACPEAFRGAYPSVAEAAVGRHLPGSSGRNPGYRYLGARASADAVTLFQRCRPKPNPCHRGASTRRCPSCSRRGQPPRPEQAGRARRVAWRALWKGGFAGSPVLGCPSAEASGWPVAGRGFVVCRSVRLARGCLFFAGRRSVEV